MSGGHGPWTPVGNTVVTSASTSIYAFSIPAGMLAPRFWVANLNASAVARISFVTASATAAEATQAIPILPYDHEMFVVATNQNAILVTGATTGVVLAYPESNG
jgi:hypothetical protein